MRLAEGVVGLWEAVCQVLQLLWHADGAEQFLLLLSWLVIVHAQLIDLPGHDCRLEDLVTIGPAFRLELKHAVDELAELLRESVGNGTELAC